MPPRFWADALSAFRPLIIPAMSLLTFSFTSASISRASRPETTGVGSVRPQMRWKTKLVNVSNPFPWDDVAPDDPETGTRGSFADANGRAFVMMPPTSKLSPTVNRFALVFRFHRLLLPALSEKVTRHW